MSATTEWVVHERDGQCLYGFWFKKPCKFGVDPHHITPVSQGGRDVKENLITLCRSHHDLAQSYKIPADELRGILSSLYGYKYEVNHG